MDKVIFLPLEEDLIEFVADKIIEISNGKRDLSNIRVVFPGKRPGHFLRIKLARKMKKSFFPPEIQEIEKFVHDIVSGRYQIIKKIDPLNAAWLVYESARKFVSIPEFESFYHWAINLYKLFDELDQELVEDLESIPDLVEIESDLIPGKIQEIWRKIKDIKTVFDEKLIDSGYYSPGMLYKLVAKNEDLIPEQFTIFAGFFALTASQKRILQNILKRDLGIAIFQGDPDKWSILREIKNSLPEPHIVKKGISKIPEFKIFSGFDLHSEMAKVRDILGDLENELTDKPDKLAIILPKTESLIPLIYQAISHFPKNFNIAMGYPLKRTPLISLYEAVFRTQENRIADYFRKDVLKVLTHPFVKNLKIEGDTTPFRIAVHTFEEYVNQYELVVFDLRDRSFLNEIFKRIRKTLPDANIAEKVVQKFREVIRLFFYNFENITTFKALKEALEESATFLLENGNLGAYRLNFEFLQKFFDTVRSIEDFFFINENFEPHNIYRIFLYRLKEARVAFEGTPVQGIQILGSLEARGLNFENIIYLDLNEGIVPGEPEINPIIPPPLRATLGLSDHKKTEEIYRYHFKRLFHSSRRAYLLYMDTPSSARSRYLEELIWQKEKEAGEILEDKLVEKRIFNVKFQRKIKEEVQKTDEIMEILRNMIWSPTAIDTYLYCPMRFYFRYILNMRDESASEDIGRDKIGQIVHSILYSFYRPNIGKKADYTNILTKERLYAIIDEKFRNEYPEKWGTALLVKKATESALMKFLKKEKSENPDRYILELELPIRTRLKFGDHEILFTGRIDRVERVNGEILITDYKTSKSLKNPLKKPRKTDDVKNSRDRIKKFVESFQLPIYLELYRSIKGINGYQHINARLVSLKDFKERTLFDIKDNRDEKMKRILNLLEELIYEIFDPEIPFYVDGSSCKGCPYIEFCGVEYS